PPPPTTPARRTHPPIDQDKQSASRRVQLRRVNCAGIELEPPWNLVEPPWNRIGTLKNLLKSTMEPWNLFFKKSNQGN
ncbi:hypothetical protein OFN62_31960, partial [Escherichia coli]|nr:hypothetical protein [Escherichia coli]